MERRLFGLFGLIFGATASVLSGQELENRPIIVSERLQEIAQRFPVAERLGIDWDEAEPDAISDYMGVLAATSVLAQEIATRNDREEPIDADYEAALFLECFWPPFKPPHVEETWQVQVSSFYDASMREMLAAAVGAGAADIVPTLMDQPAAAAVEAGDIYVPEDPEEYYMLYFDVRPFLE